MRSMLLLLVLCLQALIPAARATSFMLKPITCPVCEDSYMVSVVRTWNYTLSGGAEPPTPEGQCPHCLYAWRVKSAAGLDETQKKRVRAALQAASTRIAPGVRTHLVKENRMGNKALLDYFVAVCDEAIGDREAPVLEKLPKHEERTELTADQREFKRVLPQMLTELRAGKLKTLPKDSGDREMGALFSAADEIKNGDRAAAEFFLRWLASAPQKEIARMNHAVARNLIALAALPAGEWPDVPRDQMKMPLMSDCVQYLASAEPAPKSLREILAGRKWDGIAEIVSACCGERKDRSVAPIFLQRIEKSVESRPADAVGIYFTTVGVAADLPALEGYAKRIDGFSRRNVEGALRAIRIRAALTVADAER